MPYLGFEDRRTPYLGFDIQTIIIKYVPNEMINHLKNKSHNWKKLYQALYKSSKVEIVYKYPKNYGIKNKYLNAILNKLNININLRISLIVQCSLGFSSYGIDKNTFINGAEGPNQKRHNFKSDIIQVSGVFGSYLVLLNNGMLYTQDQSYLPEYISNNQLEIFFPIIINKKIIYVEIKRGLIVICENGKIMASGSNFNWELGFCHNDNVKYLTEVNIDKKAIQVVSGNIYTIILLEEGNIMITGRPSSFEGESSAYSAFKGFSFVDIKLIAEKLAYKKNIVLNSNSNKAVLIRHTNNYFYVLFENGLVISIYEHKQIVPLCCFNKSGKFISCKETNPLSNCEGYNSEVWELYNNLNSRIINIKTEGSHIVFIREPK